MKKRIFVSLGIMVFFLSFTVTTSFAENWIIDSKSNKLPKDLAQRVELVGGKLLKSWDFIGIAVAEFPTEADALAIETEGLKVMPDIEINWLPDEEQAEATHIGEDEFFYGYQWHLPLIEADKAWDDGVTGAGVRVAVLDTGIWYHHYDLDHNIDFASSASFVPGVPDFLDDHGHGTHVAGIIAAEDNAFGSIGVAPNATLIAVKVLNQNGGGAWSWILGGVIHAVNVDADIINMSLRGYIKKSGTSYYTSRYASQLLATMNKTLNWAASQDTLVVVAAGNELTDLNHIQDWAIIPTEAGNCIAVSATGPADDPAYYTNFGTSVVWVAAPGGDFMYDYPYGGILSTIPPPDLIPDPYVHWYSFYQGTSMATPCVCGVAALVLEKYGPMSMGRLKNILANSAEDLGKPGKDDYYGRGRVNAYEAVNNKK